MPNILSILNDPSSPYSSADEPTPIEQKVASGTIYRVTDETVAVLADGYYYDSVEWDTSNVAPVVGVDCVIGFDQDNAPYLLQWQGMGTQASLAAGGDASGSLDDLVVNTVEGGKTPLTTDSSAGGDASGTLSDLAINTVKNGKTPLTADQNLNDLASKAAAIANLGLFPMQCLTTSYSGTIGVPNGSVPTGICDVTITAGNTAETWIFLASVVGAANSANWTPMVAYINTPWGVSYQFHGYHNTAASSSDSTYTSIPVLHMVNVPAGESSACWLTALGPSPFGWYVYSAALFAVRVA